MKITAHTAAVLNPTTTPVRGASGHIQARPTGTVSSPTPAGPTRPSSLTSLPSTSAASSFASVFQAYSQSALTQAQGSNSATVQTAVTNTTAVTAASAASSSTAASSTAAATSTTAASSTTQTPGISALVTAIMNGSFKPTYVTDASKLQETNPAGTTTMPNFYYASDQTAAQLAQLLGGKVVQMTPFGQDKGWSEPVANFIQLPNGQTFNAADVAYYARCGAQGPQQLTADITQCINEGSALTNYYHGSGPMPVFSMGYVGPPISGMTYAPGTIGADGNVINPAMGG